VNFVQFIMGSSREVLLNNQSSSPKKRTHTTPSSTWSSVATSESVTIESNHLKTSLNGALETTRDDVILALNSSGRSLADSDHKEDPEFERLSFSEFMKVFILFKCCMWLY
jgi:hypothetical protein